MSLITQSNEISNICDFLSTKDYIAVDTEFMRDRYYYPKLCLIQISFADNYYLIDALAPNIDLTPLWKLFQNPNVIKVIHSASQDIETIFYLSSNTISPIFDTQIAAMALGYQTHTSYANLINDFLGVRLNKQEQYSSWDQRPLSPNQIEYAIADVTYLYKLYPLIQNKLAALNRIDWIKDELLLLEDKFRYVNDPESAWQKLHIKDANSSYVGILKSLCSWRELTAQQENIPKTHILKDQVIIEIATRRPKTPNALYKIKGSSHLNNQHAIEIIKSIEQGINNPIIIPKEVFPRILTSEQKYTIDLFKIALNIISSKNSVAEKLIASSDEIIRFIIDNDMEVKFMRNWRYEIFGKIASKLKNSQSAITYRNQRAELIDL